MNENYLTGIGLIAESIADLLLRKDYALALTNFMKGLGSFKLHENIVKAMEAPKGQASPAFEKK